MNSLGLKFRKLVVDSIISLKLQETIFELTYPEKVTKTAKILWAYHDLRVYSGAFVVLDLFLMSIGNKEGPLVTCYKTLGQSKKAKNGKIKNQLSGLP